MLITCKHQSSTIKFQFGKIENTEKKKQKTEKQNITIPKRQ